MAQSYQLRYAIAPVVMWSLSVDGRGNALYFSLPHRTQMSTQG